MSQENVEVVHQVFELWKRGGWSGGREFFDDSCEAVFSTSWFPDAGVYQVGREALRAWFGFMDSFETFAIRVVQIIDAGEHVVVLARIQGRGRASGADVDAKVGGIFTLRDAKILRYVLTDDLEALEAVGPRE
jgi:ketosteroid isomerase-like protein